MAIPVMMPRLGWDMQEGSLVEWQKHDGDSVQPGDVLCTIEGDKAVDELTSMDAGTLRIPPDAPAPGRKVPVGTVLAYLVAAGEAAPFEREGAPPATAGRANTGRDPGGTAGARATAGGVATGASGPVPAPTLLPPLAPGGDAASAGAGGPSVAVKSGPSPSAARHQPPVSPRARRIAAELGLEWSALAGSGRSGRIVERDVRRAAASARVASAASPAAETAADPLTAATVEAPAPAVAAPSEMQTVVAATGATTPTPAAPPVGMAEPTVAASSGHQEGQRQPLGGVRQIVAARMAESARTAAPVTLTTDADATDLVRLRQQMAADLAGSDQPLPSYTDCLAKLVAGVLQDLPYMNASLVGSEIVQHAAIHLGLAVDTPRGLLVPVLRDVPGKSLLQVARESAALIERARSGRIAADELRGSTFTITNLGMYEIDAFTPIINLPECAILGVGRIIARPVVLDPATEKISVRQQLALSLTFDHRVVDGAPAARFLQRVKQVIEHPIGWLMR